MSAVSCTIGANGLYECGTGGWVGPKPGDPNTANILITAKPAFGGIDVNWGWPDINPEAVAFTQVWRSLLPTWDSATLHRNAVQGSFYFDQLENDTATAYYYWVVVVSVYGTYSDPIGPAWATAMPRIEQMITDLSGKIDNGMLAQSLKGEIARIQLNSLAISQEMLDRDAADDALGVRVDVVGAHSGETRALLQQEVLARTSANEAFVATVNTLYSELNGNIAAVQTQVTALVTEVGALSSKIDNVETEFNGNLAQVQQTLQTNIDTVNGKVVAIGALWNVQMTVNGLAGGFGVYNDGRTVEAGFDVDRFWVGRTNANKRKPFIIENDVVYMDDAAINKLTFNKLRDETGAFLVQNGKIQAKYLEVEQVKANQVISDNYVPQTSGFALMANGTFQLNGASGGYRVWQTENFWRLYQNGIAFPLVELGLLS